MRINSRITQALIILLLFLLPGVMSGKMEIEPPASALEPPVPLDNVSLRQLDYLMKIPSQVNLINQMNFFKPYSESARQKISLFLEKAADLEPDECHKKYLFSLSYDVLQDDFQSYAPNWYSLTENKVEIIFLPNKSHKLQEIWLKSFFQFSSFGLDRANWEKWQPFSSIDKETLDALTPAKQPKIFDTFIYINDLEQTDRFTEYTDLLDKMHDNVPQEKDKIIPFTPIVPRIKIAHLLYSSWPGRVSVVFPERKIYDQYGRFKIVIFKNVLDAYVKCILRPIASKIFDFNPLMQAEVDTDSYLSNLVMYKLAHQMGPMFMLLPKKTESEIKKEMELRKRRKNIQQDKEMEEILEREKAREKEDAKREMEEKKVASKEIELFLISDAIGSWFPLAKDLKASVISIHNTSVLIENGLVPKTYDEKIYYTYIASLVDNIRKDPMGRSSYGSIIQFNYLLRNEAIRFNIGTKKITLQSHLFPTVIKKFAELVIDKYRAPQIIYGDFGALSPELKTLLDDLNDIPVDVDIDVNIKKQKHVKSVSK